MWLSKYSKSGYRIKVVVMQMFAKNYFIFFFFMFENYLTECWGGKQLRNGVEICFLLCSTADPGYYYIRL